MRKKKAGKKLLALGISVAMIAGVAACSSGGNVNTSSAGSQTGSSQADGSYAGGNQGSGAGQSGSEVVNLNGGGSAVKVNKQLIDGDLSRVAVHDPSIVVDADQDGNAVYYLFGTHITSAKSTDLANWTIFTNGYKSMNNTLYGNLSENLSEPFQWAGENDSDCKGGFAVWAPDVIYNERYVKEDGSTGAYMIYFCTSSTYCRSAIAYAVADTIEGPYEYKGTLVYSGFTKDSAFDDRSKIDKEWTNTNIDDLMEAGRIEEGFQEEWASSLAYNTDYAPNAIDPAIYTDTDGRMWMCYGSWSGGIYTLEIDPATGDAIYPKTNGTTEDGRVIDKYFGTRIAGGHTLSGEGPYIVYDAETGYYYLYTTYNFLDASSGYNMRLFRSTSPTGPFLDAAGNNAVFDSRMTNQYKQGIKVMGNYYFSSLSKGYRSPGHCSALIDSDGKRYLFYHTRFESGGEGFEVRVHQQFMNEDGWPVTAVYENREDVIAEEGYDTSAIVGTYEYINHGTASDGANVKEPEIITLLEDGTIEGAVSGTWTEADGSYLAAFEIGETTYKGVFFEQHDESKNHELVMTFTAIGSNNETIWGVKAPDGRTYESKEVTISGEPGINLEAVDKVPVVKYEFEAGEEEPELHGDALIQDGCLILAKSSDSYGKTYAELPSLEEYDFSDGVTLVCDLMVSKYGSDWTPVFMIGDGRVGGDAGSLAYHFTQGFSSVVDIAGQDKIGYYGADIKKPYSWDYFGEREHQNEWHSLAVTISSGEMATYIDGKKVQTGTGDYSKILEAFDKASGNYIGGSYFTADPDFAGRMDNVAIYSEVLTDSEVKALMGK